MTIEHRRAVFLQEMHLGALWLRRNPDSAVDVATDSGLPCESVVAVAAVPAAAVGIVTAVAEVADIDDSAVRASVAAPPHGAPATSALASSVSVGAVASHPIADLSAAWDDVPLAIDPLTLPHAAELALMDWAQLQAAVAACRGCDLCQRRNQTVFGSGDRHATWLFVGEGPGRTEDQQGAPFVGAAGKLLDSMLTAIGLQRDADVYLTNVVKCRSTDANGIDHAPSQQQSAMCQRYLERQIAMLQPTVIVALGKTAALTLLDCAPDTTLSSLRGRLHQVQQRPLVVTYHPAYLLRKPIAKREAWDDLCLALRTHTGQTGE